MREADTVHGVFPLNDIVSVISIVPVVLCSSRSADVVRNTDVTPSVSSLALSD